MGNTSNQISRAFYLSKILGSPVGHADVPSRMKDKLLHLVPPTIKTETKTLMSLFGFWRQHIRHFWVLLLPKYKVTKKAASFEWGLEHEKALQQVKAAVQAALPLEPHDPMVLKPMELKVSVADSDVV